MATACATGTRSSGTTAGLDLPAIGASAVRKDVLLEADWFDDANDCAAHSHRPTTAVRNRLAAAFSAAPVANPDGSTGINVVLDHGQGGALSGGNLVADTDGVLTNGVNSSEYVALKTANFAANRNGYFHYILMPHRYSTTSSSSGQAEINGDDLIVSLQCASSTVNTANTIMHELGHNLGLRHGGNVDTNQKPNYSSVMNYRYQFPGVDTDCNVSGDGVLAFSSGTRITLTESRPGRSERCLRSRHGGPRLGRQRLAHGRHRVGGRQRRRRQDHPHRLERLGHPLLRRPLRR